MRRFLTVTLRPISNRSHSRTAAADASWPKPSRAQRIRSRPACGLQSNLGPTARPRHRRHPERFRQTRHSAHAHPNCSTPSPATSWTTAGPRSKSSRRKSSTRARTARRATAAPDCAAVDPDNKLICARKPPSRLDLEAAVRDSPDRCLCRPPRRKDGAARPSHLLTDAPFSTRRSVYGFIERQNLPAFFPHVRLPANPNTHTPEPPTNHRPATGPVWHHLMNSPFHHRTQAAAWPAETETASGG